MRAACRVGQERTWLSLHSNAATITMRPSTACAPLRMRMDCGWHHPSPHPERRQGRTVSIHVAKPHETASLRPPPVIPAAARLPWPRRRDSPNGRSRRRAPCVPPRDAGDEMVERADAARAMTGSAPVRRRRGSAAMSKPCLVPSRSIVSAGSRRRRRPQARRPLDRVEPVARRPMGESRHCRVGLLCVDGDTMHWLPILAARHELGPRHAPCDRRLVGAGEQQLADVLVARTRPEVSGMKHCSRCGPHSYRVSGPRASRDCRGKKHSSSAAPSAASR